MQIGAYQVLMELGRGGMGTVYLGRLMCAGGVERLVAIKRAHPRLMESPELTERFLNEARLTAQVHHANVVGLHQTGSDAEGHYLIFDYVEGESLAGIVDHMPRGKRVPPAIAVRIVLDALAGLHAAHETVDVSGTPLGMLHRDVSVENLLVGRDGVTRLADFGIAKSVLSSVVTEQGVVHGKLVYLSPEYLRRDPMGRPLDIYAMGVTLWVALAGVLPFKDLAGAQVLQAILTEGIPSLASVGVQVDPALEAIVARACHRDAAQRYQTARDMLDALEELGRVSGNVARHVQVAEFVEKIVGVGLASRRQKIKLRRDELEREKPVDTVLPFSATDRQPAGTGPRPPGPPGYAAQLGEQDITDIAPLPRAPTRLAPRTWLVYGSVLVLGLGLGYAMFAARAGTAAPLSAPARARDVEQLTGAAQRAEESKTRGAQEQAGESPSTLATPAAVPPGATVAAEPTPAEQAPEPKKRAKTAKKVGITTRNPYR